VFLSFTSYLPTPLTEAELADVADTAIAQVAANGPVCGRWDR